MQAEALEIVQQIIAAGDAGEKVADLGGPLFAGLIKDIAHAGSLAAAPAGGKAQKWLCAWQEPCYF
jgi:hypothetical protein